MSTLTFASLALAPAARGQHGQYAYAGVSVHQQSGSLQRTCWALVNQMLILQISVTRQSKSRAQRSNWQFIV